MDILIVGAGIAGLATAGFLRQQGQDPLIVEKAEKWSEVGYGISLWGSGMKILQALGLDEKLIQQGAPIDEWTLRDAKGKVLSQVELSFDELPPLTAIHRADLHELLRTKVPGASIRMNTTVDRISPAGEKVNVVLSSGEERSFDLVIGSDGIHSKVRELVFQDWELQDTGTAVFSFWMPEELNAPAGFTETYGAAGKAFLLAPVDHKMMGSIALPVEGNGKENHFRQLKEKTDPSEWLIPDILDYLENRDDVFHDKLFQVKASRWSAGRTVIIGDAAHALHPIVGMGASLALEDAYVLNQELLEKKYGDLPKALAAFQQRRAGRVQRFSRQANLTRKATFVQSAVLSNIRNELIQHTPFFEGFFVQNAEQIAQDVFREI